jgi:ribonuclease BN (tRNA processing enzyme)
MAEGSLTLQFLGTGSGFAPGRYYSSFLLNGKYLFDASPVVVPQLKKLGVDPRDIEVIFITHFHGDHYFGLPFLLLEYAELEHRTKDLTIVGPPGLQKRVEAATNLAFANVYRKRDRGYHLTFAEVKNGRSAEASNCRYTPYKLQHVPDLDAFGFRVTVDGRTVAYTGDTALCEALIPLADDADVLVCECSCWTETCGAIHMTPANVLTLRERVTEKTRFVLTHIGSGDAPREIAAAGIAIASDLETISL